MTSILLIDDRAADRELLVTVLRHAGYSVLEAATGEQGLELARSHRPHLIIVDILMPTMDGYELVRELRATPTTAEIPVMFYTATNVVEELPRLAAACGVSHVLTKPCEPEQIIAAVETALASRRSTTPAPEPKPLDGEQLRAINARLLERVEELRDAVILAGTLHQQSLDDGTPGGERSSEPWSDPPAERLSAREREVLAMLAEGATNAEIAAHLVIAGTTVQSHVKHIFHKLGVRNRTEAAVLHARAS